MIARRGFIAGLAAALCAPAIIRTPGLLMPVKAVKNPIIGYFLTGHDMFGNAIREFVPASPSGFGVATKSFREVAGWGIVTSADGYPVKEFLTSEYGWSLPEIRTAA